MTTDEIDYLYEMFSDEECIIIHNDDAAGERRVVEWTIKDGYSEIKVEDDSGLHPHEPSHYILNQTTNRDDFKLYRRESLLWP